MMQGGQVCSPSFPDSYNLSQNCTHDYMMVDYTGDSMFANGKKMKLSPAPHI
jgi:hypothetical protein